MVTFLLSAQSKMNIGNCTGNKNDHAEDKKGSDKIYNKATF